jgi:hypothetical protein
VRHLTYPELTVPDSVPDLGTMQSVQSVPNTVTDSAPQSGRPGPAASDTPLVERTREIWLPIVIFLAIRAVGLAALGRFAQLRDQGMADLLTAWDGKWMIGLAAYGYNNMPYRFVDARGLHTDDTSYAFFPGYPMLVRGVAYLPGFDAYRAALTVNVLLGCAAAVAAYRLGRLCVERMPRVPDRYADRTAVIMTVLFAAAPMAIVLSMAYTEAIYCALAGWALVGLLERRWLLSAVCTVLAGLCRPTAVVLIGVVMLSALIAIISTRGGERIRAAVCLIVAPLGWLGYLLVVAHHTGSLGGWFQVQTDGWGTTFDLGWQTFKFVNWTLVNSSDFADLSVVGLLAASVVLMIIAWRSGMPWQVTVYGSLVLISVLGSGGLMMSRPRLLLPAFVLLIPVAAALARRSTAAQVWTSLAVIAVTCWYGAYMISVYPHAI